jgi:hypothetical protein
MDITMDEDAVANFLAFTGSTPDKARQYLSVSDGNTEQAVSLFFSTGGIDLEGPAVSASTTAETREPASTRSGGREVIELDDDDDEMPDADDQVRVIGSRRREAVRSGSSTPKAVQPAVDEDEAMARRLQEEFYGGGGAAQSAGLDAEGYRAPIAGRTETLVGPDSYDFGDAEDRRYAVLEQLRARGTGRGRGGMYFSARKSGQNTNPLKSSNRALQSPNRPFDVEC